MFILTLAHFAVLAMRGGTLFYYFQYYVNQDRPVRHPAVARRWRAPRAATSLETFGLIVDAEPSQCGSVGFSLFNISSQFVTVIGVVCSTFLARGLERRRWPWSASRNHGIHAAFVLLPAESIGTMFLLEWVRALTYAPTIPLIWAMFADVVDYSEWKTGRRITGIVYATILFGLKTGLSLGGAIGRLAALRLRLSAQRRADAGGAPGHSHDDQRLSRDSVSSS